MRKNYIDNLRSLFVLLLFVYHTFMIYNSFGENFYIKGQEILLTTGFMVALWPWYMPLLFVLAGVSAAFALEKRDTGQYVKERVYRLLIPLLFGVLLLVPAQTFFAERFHNGYGGGYWEQYALFFTKPTDLTGYTGGFTPGHLWFLAYLFVISLVALPVIYLFRNLSGKKGPALSPDKMPALALIPLFVLPLLFAPVLNIGGKSLGEYFAYFCLGYFVLSRERIIDRLEKYRFFFSAFALAGMILYVAWWRYGRGYSSGLPLDCFERLYAWVAILALLGMGKRHLNFKNRATDYFSRASFSVYIFHQTCLVAAAYMVFQITGDAFIQIVFIMGISIASTFAVYEIIKRIPGLRLLFGIK
ncbi:MAG: acyltransferase family protein [Clostridiales bacterium]|nr:acyltransferase family protein [Clostridiales bacterium]